MSRIFLTIIGFISRLFRHDLKNGSKMETLQDFQENINVGLLLLAQIGVLILVVLVVVSLLND